MNNKYYIYKIQYKRLCHDLDKLVSHMQKLNMSKIQISTIIMTLVRDSINLTGDLLKEEEINE